MDWRCQVCGSVNGPSNYCTTCGTAMPAAAAPGVPPPVAHPEAPHPAQGGPPLVPPGQSPGVPPPPAGRGARRPILVVAIVGAVVLLVAAGAGAWAIASQRDSEPSDPAPSTTEEDDRTESSESEGTVPEPDPPVRGGSVTYAVEAETVDGWCLPEVQLAISGVLVARAIFDTLTAPNDRGEYVPYLAESVEPDDDFTSWTITLRDGITFHDGSDLTAEVVQNNLDAYRGLVGPSSEATPHPTRSPVVSLFLFDNIDDVRATGDLEVTVTTTVPWVAFPAFLYSGGRLGMLAQAQLDDEETCDSSPIGTGPFMLESWDGEGELVARANPDYWQEALDGKPYPYLDEIRFQVVIESEQRVDSLDSGSVDIAHFSAGEDFETLDELENDGTVISYDSDEKAEVTFLQMNASTAPFDDVRVRRAMALAVDRDELNEVVNRGYFTVANGPFAVGSVGYLEETGFPIEQDLDEAERLVAEYEEEHGQIPTIDYQATPGTSNQEMAVFVQQMADEVGITVRISTVQPDTLTRNAIAGDYELMGFRNYPGGDPDELYLWFQSTSPLNFGRIDDAEVDDLLEEGRSEPDPDARAEIYQDLNRELGQDVWSVWLHWTTWRVASRPEVHGYDPESAPELPNRDAFDIGLATGHPLHGVWVTD